MSSAALNHVFFHAFFMGFYQSKSVGADYKINLEAVCK